MEGKQEGKKDGSDLCKEGRKKVMDGRKESSYRWRERRQAVMDGR